jgi:RecA/RadA recombinase
LNCGRWTNTKRCVRYSKVECHDLVDNYSAGLLLVAVISDALQRNRATMAEAPQTAWSLRLSAINAPRLSVGCPVLHAALGHPDRGLCVQGITELAGESSAGKTQFCLTLAVRTVFSALLSAGAGATGLESGAVPLALVAPAAAVMYINSEDKVPTQRLRQITEEVASAALAAGIPVGKLVQAGLHGQDPPPTCDDIVSALLGQVLVADVADAEDLDEVVARLPGLVAARGLRLVIVDSIAALFRAEVLGVGAGGLGGAGGGYAERARRLCKVAASLKALQAEHPACAVVLTNQVTDVIMEGSSGEGLPGRSSGLSGAARSLAAGLGSAGGSGPLSSGAGDSGAGYSAFAVESNGRFVRPALGPSWDSCITTRILLTHQRSLGPVLHAPVGAHPPLPLEMGQRAPRVELPLPGGDAGDSASSSVLPSLAPDASTSSSSLSSSSTSSSSSAAPTQAPLDTAPPAASNGTGAAGALQPEPGGTPLPAAPHAVDVSPPAFAGGAGGDYASCSVREAHLLLSPCYPRRVCRFAVVRGGLRGVEPVLSLAPD